MANVIHATDTSNLVPRAFPLSSGNDVADTRRTSRKLEPLIPQDPPKRPWSHVAVELCTYNNKKWLTIVDYWSDYVELNQLPATNASIVNTSLKTQFARHGKPDTRYVQDGRFILEITV